MGKLSFSFDTDKLQKRSDEITKGVDRAPGRSLLYAKGRIKRPADMDKPFIAVCNSYIEIVPGMSTCVSLRILPRRRFVRRVGYRLSSTRSGSMTVLRWATLGCATHYPAGN